MLALALLLTSAASDPLCARALRAAPDLSCAAAGHGVALASTPNEAERLAGYARAGEARFAERLGRDIAPYVVVSTPPVPARTALAAAGFVHVLPWPAPRAFDDAARRGVEQGARRFAASQNMSSAQTEEVVARAMSQIPDATAQAALDAGMVPHELGHLWFTAAVVLEDEATAAMRRDQFRAMMKGETLPAIGPLDGRALLLDLQGLLSREHPGLARAVEAAPEVAASGGIGVSFTPAAAGPRPAALERIFYIQNRVFADYLIQTSGRAAILADIAQAVADGKSVEAWLSEKGADYGLPASIIDLQHDWEQFAIRRADR